MKRKFLFLSIAIIGISISSCSSDDNNTSIPEEITSVVKNAFSTKYPSAENVHWANVGGYEVADFNNNTVKSSAWYDANGTWYMTETDLTYTALPAEIKKSFEASEYATWKIDDVEMLERTGYETIYIIEAELQGSDVELYYSADGILIKSILDNANKDPQNHIPTPTPTDISGFIASKYTNARIIEIDDEDGMIEVEIIHDNIAKDVYFSQQKEWLYTSWEINKHLAPAFITNAVNNSAYAGYEIDDIDYIETSTTSYYLVELERGDYDVKIKVDVDGNIINNNNNGSNNGTGNGTGTVTPTPSDIETFINTKYTNARIVEVDTDDGLIEVEIIHNNIEKDVYFDLQKQWLYTSWDVSIISLPSAVSAAVSKSYPSYFIDDVDYIETASGDYYLVEIERGNIETKIKVDANGNILP